MPASIHKSATHSYNRTKRTRATSCKLQELQKQVRWNEAKWPDLSQGVKEGQGEHFQSVHLVLLSTIRQLLGDRPADVGGRGDVTPARRKEREN